MFNYPITNDDGDLLFILQTVLTKGEVMSHLAEIQNIPFEDFPNYLEENGMKVISGFENSIVLA